MRRRGFGSLAWASALDLFDQATAFGRLALVHVIMMAGDTLITVSLAGSLFFSVSPTEAKTKVLLYLLLTVAPFAVVSPLLGPLIDRSTNGRRLLVAVSAAARCVLCYSMSSHLNSWILFPEAFFVLMASKLYVVTRGALVPEMARTDQFRDNSASVDGSGWPSDDKRRGRGFSGFNAQLTLLGTVSGMVAGLIGAGILKSIGATSVLIFAAIIYATGVVASLRLQRPAPSLRVEVESTTAEERDLQLLQPMGDQEVMWGLAASSTVRFGVGFTTFLLAFGLRRDHAALSWYAFALGLSGVGSLLGLGLVTRIRSAVRESGLLTLSLLALGAGSLLASLHPTVVVQGVLAGWMGVCASVAQPSFDAITQRHVPPGLQGRTFARFAVRQQLFWVLGALIPVAIALRFGTGDALTATVGLAAGVIYALGRR